MIHGYTLALVLAVFLAAADPVLAFSPSPKPPSSSLVGRLLPHHLTRAGPLNASRSINESQTASVLSGVADFESWLRENGEDNLKVKHAAFGLLRGLALDAQQTAPATVVNIPTDLVLSTEYDEENAENWDTELALQLCDELKLKEKSDFAGYLSLLTYGTYTTSISVAPNSIRHWDEDQRDTLKNTVKGSKLLQLNEKQQKQWKRKYDSIPSTISKPDWSTFAWAMEVVHSRAFKGIASSPVAALPKIVAPILAGIAGFRYSQSVIEPDLIILAALGVISLLPTFLVGSSSTAALLPVIDSANHLESADSTILYDPLKRSYQLNIGEKCVVDGQMYITYGKKSDSELLLNYGFLPGVSCDIKDEDEIREQLAKAYLSR